MPYSKQIFQLKKIFLRNLLALLFCFLSFTSTADEFDTLQFNASVDRSYDDNLFRVKNNQTSDQITTSKAGIVFDKTYSLQRVVIDLSYVDYRYQTNDFLNFEAFNYDAKWFWSLTPSLTGQLSSSRNKTLNGFSDFRSFTQNIRTSEINQFRAEYSPFKVWSLIGGFTETSQENSQVFNAQAQYDATAIDYGARYNFSSGSNISLLGHKRNGQFQRPINQVSFFDNGFYEDEFELDVVLKPTGKSNLKSKLAYLSRQYDNFSNRNYDVWLGYANYDLLLTGKIKASLGLVRSVGPFETDYSTYSVTDAVNLGISYLYSDKVSFIINGRLSERDFRQGVIPGLPKREDSERSLSASVAWRPVKNIGFTLSSIKSSRDASTSAYNNFDFDDLTTSVMVDLRL